MLELAVLAIVTAVLTFLVYKVIQMVFGQKAKVKSVKETMYDLPYKPQLDEPPLQEITPQVPAYEEERQVPEEKPAETRDSVPSSATPPEIPGQTEEQYNAPEPLQERVSTAVEEAPNAKDPYEQADNVALFGSNLRHPEAMMASGAGDRYLSLERNVSAGLADQVARPATVDETPFSAEMAQNGGQFMKGIFAFDSSDTGTAFSSY
jgi:cytoskeletal protein RodZ